MKATTRVLRGVFWTTLSFGSRQVLQTIIGIALARILVPDIFGVVALANVAIGVMGLVRNTGLGAAIVRQPGLTDEQATSTFWFNCGINALMTIGLVALSPLLADLLHEPRTRLVMVALAPNFLLGALTTVHAGLLSRQRDFRTLALRETLGVALSGLVAVAVAWAGGGLASLVAQSLTANLFAFAFLWRAVVWRPTLRMRWSDIRPLLAYGLPLGGSDILQYLTRNLDNLLVGRFLGAFSLGLYAFSYNAVLVPIQVVQSILGRVMFPEMARVQDDRAAVVRLYLGSLRYIATLMWLPLGGLLVLAPVAMGVVYGPHWRPAAPLVQLFCLVAISQAVGTTIGWIFASQGKTHRQFVLTLVFGIIVYAAFIVGLRWGVLGVTVGYALVNFTFGWPMNALAFRIIGLSMARVLGALKVPFAALAAMVLVLQAFLLSWQHARVGAAAWLLVAGAVLGTSVYVLVLWALDRALVLALAKVPAGFLRRDRGAAPAAKEG